jgi:hypothetical protein
MERESRGALLGVLLGPLTTLSIGAAAIHFAVVGEHFQEWWGFGLFFSALGWFQALWAVGYALRPTRWLAWLAIAVNGATIVVWIWSRTIGLPFGPDPGMPEAIGVPDVLSTALEVLLVIGLVVSELRGPRSAAETIRVSTIRAALNTALATAVVVVVTTLVLSTQGAG